MNDSTIMNAIKMKYFTKVNYRHVWNEQQERIMGQVKLPLQGPNECTAKLSINLCIDGNT